MKDLKTALSVKNGFSDERYVELVREGVKEEHPQPDDEIAILRKEIAFLRGVIETRLGVKLPPSEFTAYNEKTERIKAEAKAKVGK